MRKINFKFLFFDTPLVAVILIFMGCLTFFTSGKVTSNFNWNLGNKIGATTAVIGLFISLFHLVPRTRKW
jgi:uncharacterized membrane protein HdeD (DUF308 family)